MADPLKRAMRPNARVSSVNREMPCESTLTPTNLSALCAGQEVPRAHDHGRGEREVDEEMGDGRQMIWEMRG